jgi:hypothetical protein
MKTFYKPKLEVADVFNKFGHLLGSLPRDQIKVIKDIKSCRTAALGGHMMKCDACEHEKNIYNSCRSRHCPKCQFLGQTKWIDRRKDDLLPCQYFHVIFTAPEELRPLILRNKKVAYDILFKAASQTLKEIAADPVHLGAEIGCIGILHTWSQVLLDHAHIHFIVPGGGLNKNMTNWLKCRKDYLAPVEILSSVFKGKLLEFFRDAFDEGQLKFMGKIEHLCSFPIFQDLLSTCASKDFVVFSKESFAGPEQVIKYLGQYTHRIAISNFRLVKLEGENVFFKYRNRKDATKKKVMSLHVKEFMRRFLLHVLPKGYVRIRHFGLLGSRFKKIKLSIIRRIKGVKEKIKKKLKENWKVVLKEATGINVDTCPKCKKGTLHIIKGLTPIPNST